MIASWLTPDTLQMKTDDPYSPQMVSRVFLFPKNEVTIWVHQLKSIFDGSHTIVLQAPFCELRSNGCLKIHHDQSLSAILHHVSPNFSE